METLSAETGVMSATERTSESSRLVGPSPNAAKPSYMNLFSNICSIIFLGIIIYCCFANGVTLFSFHPCLMTLGWLIIMTSAVNSISPGDFATEWMPMRLRSARHWVLQLIGGTIIVTGFLIILSNKIINDKPHFASLHSKFGLAAFILMLGTMVGGIGALYSLQLKSYLAPLYTKLLHASVGLTTFILGVIAILLGLFSNWWTFGETLRYTGFILVLAIMLCTILRPSLKIYFRVKERLENTN